MSKLPPLVETLTREVTWDCPGLWKGALSAVYERRIASDSVRMGIRIGASSSMDAPEMNGDFSGLLETLRAPRPAHWEKTPARESVSGRRNAQPSGRREWRLSGVRQTTYGLDGKKPLKFRRHERLDWQWANGPYGEIPGVFGLNLPETSVTAVPGDADGPIVLGARLAAYLLNRIVRSGATPELLRAVPSPIAFDDEGFPPTAGGLVACRTPLEPWPHPLPGSFSWKLDRPVAAVESLPTTFLALSFAALEVEEGEFHWALPYFHCRHGKMTGIAGIHLHSGPLDELGNMIKGFGGDSSTYGLAPRCNSPSLILRPLSKMKGRRIPFTPQPESDFALQAAREFILSLM